jgi:hypothetical protein
MRTAVGILVLVLSQGLAGCNSHSPVVPTTSASRVPAPPPPPTTAAGEHWNLTTTLRSDSGPTTCVEDITHMFVGHSANWLMTIERFGDSVHLVVADVVDPNYRLTYEGTVVADVLTVPLNTYSSAGWCRERGRVEFSGETQVSGRFSGDGRALTAKEVTRLQLTSGEALNFHFEWTATRR